MYEVGCWVSKGLYVHTCVNGYLTAIESEGVSLSLYPPLAPKGGETQAKKVHLPDGSVILHHSIM